MDWLCSALVETLLDDHLESSHKIRRIDAALDATRRRTLLVDKVWGRSAASFLAAWLLLEAIYLFGSC